MLRAIRAMLYCLLKQCMSNNKWHSSCTVQPVWVTFRLSSLWHHPSTSQALYIVATTAQRHLWMSHVSCMIREHVFWSAHLCPTQNHTFLRSIYFVAATVTPLYHRNFVWSTSLSVFTLPMLLSYRSMYILSYVITSSLKHDNIRLCSSKPCVTPGISHRPHPEGEPCTYIFGYTAPTHTGLHSHWRILVYYRGPASTKKKLVARSSICRQNWRAGSYLSAKKGARPLGHSSKKPWDIRVRNHDNFTPTPLQPHSVWSPPRPPPYFADVSRTLLHNASPRSHDPRRRKR